MVRLSRHIVTDPEVCHGKPVFTVRGGRPTRIMVYLVLEMLEAGMTPEQILAEYPSLTKAAIQDALHFAAELSKYPPYAASRVPA